jgi:NAD(P)-dependent dehydrogenase (short-subunit alcohol dehydrogenase family)
MATRGILDRFDPLLARSATLARTIDLANSSATERHARLPEPAPNSRSTTDLAGKVVLITGGARGIGAEAARQFIAAGARVALLDRDAEVKATAATLGAEAIGLVADVTDTASIERAVAAAVKRFGGIDVVVANAGILSWGNAWELTTEAWNELIDINLTGVFHTIKATVPHMIAAKKGGAIILTSSSAGLKGQPFTLAYTAAKHGVVGITRGLANELGEYDIRVNSIHPAGVETEMMNVNGLFQMIQGKAATLGPIFMNTLPHQSMKPEAVSAVVAFLASDEARYLTGAQIPVDLGTLNR